MMWSFLPGKIKFMESCVECISCKHFIFEIIECLVELWVPFYNYLDFMEKIVKKFQKLPIKLISWLFDKHFIYLVPKSIKWVSINLKIRNYLNLSFSLSYCQHARYQKYLQYFVKHFKKYNYNLNYNKTF